MLKIKFFFIISAVLLLGAANGANAALLKSYDFNGGLSDTLGNGLDLVASGGIVSGGRYGFSPNQGLSLSSALSDTSNYAIEMKLQITDSLSGYNKLIDFQGLSSDIGLYELNGAIDFYTAGPVAGTVTLATDFIVGLARAAGSIEVFLNGTSLFTAADGGQAISLLNVLNFFEDDTATGQREAFVGSVDWIRIHDSASTLGETPSVSVVPLPASLPLFGTGLAVLGFLGWRRKHKSAVTA